MDVFISWSGKRSGAAAEALRDWLPKIINALKPWLSAADIDKGARWGTEIATKLKDCKGGIICLTPDNLHSDWLLFEAGALSKTIENTYVCPFLIGLEPADVEQPLAQFQATRAAKGEVLKLIKTLNSALGEAALAESHIDEAFEVWWPKLESKLNSLPDAEGSSAAAGTGRDIRDMVEEVLALVRNLNRPPETATAIAQTTTAALRNLNEELDRRLDIRLRKVLIENAVKSSDPRASDVDMEQQSQGIMCTVTSGDATYGFLVPNDVDTSEIGVSVSKLMSDLAVRHRRARPPRN